MLDTTRRFPTSAKGAVAASRDRRIAGAVAITAALGWILAAWLLAAGPQVPDERIVTGHAKWVVAPD